MVAMKTRCIQLKTTPQLVIAQVCRDAINALEQTLIHISTRKLIDSAIWTHHINVVELYIRACRIARALDVAGDAAICSTGRALDVGHEDVGNGQIRGELVAERQVLLAVALRHFDAVGGVGHVHGVVGDVVDSSGAAATLEVAAQLGGTTGPDFDASAIGDVTHGAVVDLRKDSWSEWFGIREVPDLHRRFQQCRIPLHTGPSCQR